MQVEAMTTEDSGTPQAAAAAAGAGTPTRSDTDTDTVELGGDRPATPLPMLEDIDGLLAHLQDACPLITSDPIEAHELGARYVIGDEIGSGAIGQVIEAYDQHLSRSVAIKVLHGGQGVSRERLARFIAEAQITAQLQHPSVVPVYEIGRMPGGMPYFAMKIVQGESLDDIINNLRVGDEEHGKQFYGKSLIRMFLRLCQGLAYAHHKRVVHRDLKPSNILIGKYGEVQIMDWGLAKIMGSSKIGWMDSVQTVRGAPELGTMDGQIAGTPAYMSPEQARGEVEKIGPPSDVYSLGLMLAELLTLVRVFRSDHPETTLDQVRQARAVELDELNPDLKVAPELAAIVRKCTAPSIQHRYPNASELAEDLKKYLEDREISIAPDDRHRKVMKWSRRHPRLAGALIAAAAIASIQALWHLLRALL